MLNQADDNSVSRRSELLIRRIGSLSTLPQVAAAALKKLSPVAANIAELSRTIEADAALTVKILSLAGEHGIIYDDNNPSIAQATAKLPSSAIQDAVLSINVFDENSPDSERILPRKQLAIHNIAVACCTKAIAGLILPENLTDLAFSAGLCHDIGKLAIDEVMPKSFQRIVQRTKSQKTSILTVERRLLGMDHTILGKRLAEKWNLPEQIILAIWLHHSTSRTLTANIPDAAIASIVGLADCLAGQSDYGQSGNFQTRKLDLRLAESLGLSAEQIDRICHQLPAEIVKRTEELGLDVPNAAKTYRRLLHRMAVKLSRDNQQISADCRRLYSEKAKLDFVSELLLSTKRSSTPIDIAESLATGWQKHFQTGPVCVYLNREPGNKWLEAVTIDSAGSVKTTVLDLDDDTVAIPLALQKKFTVIDDCRCIDWLFAGLDVNFDPVSTKLVPLRAGSKAVGAIVFQLRLPIEINRQIEIFSEAASFAAGVMAIAFTSRHRQRMTERLAGTLENCQTEHDERLSTELLDGIAEMAAGAAHELNNPLAVISGRTQILLKAETDDKKKKVLNQIKNKAQQVSAIITDLMAFARPKEPAGRTLPLRRLLDEAVDIAAKQSAAAIADVQFDNIENLGTVFVDQHQTTEAIANIISNAAQSYPGGSGSVMISGDCPQPDSMISFQIIDNGSGMDTETLAKAAKPFFSGKDAGRRRGMGLASARRLLLLNKAAMEIKSQPASGTTVTIRLPASE